MGFDANLAEALDDGRPTRACDGLVGHVDADIESRKDWADTFVKGLDVLGSSTKSAQTRGKVPAGFTLLYWPKPRYVSKQRP